MFKKWSKLSIIWLIVALVIVIGSIMYKHLTVSVNQTEMIFMIISDLSAVFGVLYVVCVAKQEKKAYLFGMVNVILYAIVVYNKSLYISAAYNMLYSFPVLIYGYIYWGKLEKEKDDRVRSFTLTQRIIGIIVMVISTVILAMFSSRVLNGENVLLDSMTSVCVCVAMFLLARKYIEQWMLFIISNFMGVILFFPKSFSDLGSIDLFAMWVVYFINSIYGYVTWSKFLRGRKEIN